MPFLCHSRESFLVSRMGLCPTRCLLSPACPACPACPDTRRESFLVPALRRGTSGIKRRESFLVPALRRETSGISVGAGIHSCILEVSLECRLPAPRLRGHALPLYRRRPARIFRPEGQNLSTQGVALGPQTTNILPALKGRHKLPSREGTKGCVLKYGREATPVHSNSQLPAFLVEVYPEVLRECFLADTETHSPPPPSAKK